MEASLLHLVRFSFDFGGFWGTLVQEQGCAEIEWGFSLHINKSANRSKESLI